MKILLSVIILFIFFASSLNASEIVGKISTDPSNPGGHYEIPEDPTPGLDQDDDEGQSPSTGPGQEGGGVSSLGGSGAVVLRNRIYEEPADAEVMAGEEEKQEDETGKEEIKVLGISFYSDGSLLRGEDKKIYLIKSGYKKYIASLEELKKYAEQEIIDVEASELEQYETRPHLDSELIREIGDEKVYVIEKGEVRHIKSIEELRANYFGLEIFNLSHEEMKLYL